MLVAAAAPLTATAGPEGRYTRPLAREHDRDTGRGTEPFAAVERSRRAFQRLMRLLSDRSERLHQPAAPREPYPRPGQWAPEREATPDPWEEDDGYDERHPRPRHRHADPRYEHCPNAGVVVEGAGWYVVRQGDTLWTIAQAHYGNGRAWRRILDANWRKIKDPSCIYACQRLYIPRWGREWPGEAGPPHSDEDLWAKPAAPTRPVEAVSAGPRGCVDCGAGSHVGLGRMHGLAD